MRIQQFLSHYGLSANPFSQEDAKEDLVFQKGCIDHTFHPQWGKIYGDPEAPSAAIVLGERGSGKTALRFQIVEHLKRYNPSHPDRRVLVIEYQDFNPFLDEFARRGNTLAAWTLNDHMDAILSLAVHRLANALTHDSEATDTIAPENLKRLDVQHRRDLLMLAAAYDQSDRATRLERWRRLSRVLRYPGILRGLATKKEGLFAIVLTACLIAGAIAAALHFGPYGWLVLAGIPFVWIPYARRWFWAWRMAGSIVRHIRVLRTDRAELRQILLKFPRADLSGQPVSRLEDSNARYDLIRKLIEAGQRLGFNGVVVVVDRVDEPTLVKGDPQKMFQLMRSIFDLKFFKDQPLGVKLLLPAEMYRPMQRNLDDNAARLDKQNFIRSLQWTGSSLYDLVNARLQACATAGQSKPTLRAMLDDTITDPEIMSWLEQLRIPRHVFKFMDRMIARHCQAHTDEHPAWKISRDTWVAARADFLRQMEDYDKGLIMG